MDMDKTFLLFLVTLCSVFASKLADDESPWDFHDHAVSNSCRNEEPESGDGTISTTSLDDVVLCSRRNLRESHNWTHLRVVESAESTTTVAASSQETETIRKCLIATLVMIMLLAIAVIVLLLLLYMTRKKVAHSDHGLHYDLHGGRLDDNSLPRFSSTNFSAGGTTLPRFSSANFSVASQRIVGEEIKFAANPSTTTLLDSSNYTNARPVESLNTEARLETYGNSDLPPLPLPPGRIRRSQLSLPPRKPEPFYQPSLPPGNQTEPTPLPPGNQTEPLPLLQVKTEPSPSASVTTEPLPPAPVKTEPSPLVPEKIEPLPVAQEKIEPPPPTSPAGPGPPPSPPPNCSSPTAPNPPPPPMAGRGPPNAPNAPMGHHRRRSSLGGDSSGPPKTKLKPLFWDKVMANPDHTMVWHNMRAGSFQFNEEQMEKLFGAMAADNKKKEKKTEATASDNTPHLINIIDAKKAQNLSILLKALNVTTEEVCDALREGNELPPELAHTLLKMAPTTDEEVKLRMFKGELSQLGPAEKFLKALLDIPLAFQRLEALLFISTCEEEFSSVKESLETLEVACTELKNSRLFYKLLEAVLKTGNRMNDGTYRGGAMAFKLDTLLKLSDVKGTDGKTTLLHFVVMEIIRSEGIRAACRLKEDQSTSSATTDSSNAAADSSPESEEYHRSLGLQVVSGLSNELNAVKKAAAIDVQSLSESVSKLGQSLKKTKDFLTEDMKGIEKNDNFHQVISNEILEIESDMKWLREEEKRTMEMVKSTGDYFHGKAAKDEAAHLFGIVRDFLLMLEKTCKDVKNYSSSPTKTTTKKETVTTSLDSPNVQETSSSTSESSMDMRKRLFPSMRDKQKGDEFNSDDEES